MNYDRWDFPVQDDTQWMRRALKEAERAYDAGEVPVGAVATFRGKMIAKAHNQREMLRDPTAHAEILAITQAAAHLVSWRLEDVVLYVTLEPCAMCAGAIMSARIPRVVFGAYDPKGGCYGSVLHFSGIPHFNHRPQTLGGVLEAECGGLLKDFFRDRRQEGRAEQASPGL